MKLRRNLPSGDMGWNQGRFEFEIVAANFGNRAIIRSYRRRGKIKPVVSAKRYMARLKLVGLTRRKESAMRGIIGRSGRGRRRRGRPPKGVYTHPSQVPGILFRPRDGGPPCRVPRGIKLKKGAMTNAAIDLGYIKPGQTISNIPNRKIDDFARDLAKKVGQGRATGMFNSQVVLRKNRGDGFRNKMVIATNAIRPKKKVVRVRRQ